MKSDVCNLYDENTKMKTREMCSHQIFPVKSPDPDPQPCKCVQLYSFLAKHKLTRQQERAKEGLRELKKVESQRELEGTSEGARGSKEGDIELYHQD